MKNYEMKDDGPEGESVEALTISFGDCIGLPSIYIFPPLASISHAELGLYPKVPGYHPGLRDIYRHFYKCRYR
jgi:hypothetical protein